ncbi:zf-HC2 domain-containing protein [Streptomyces cyaneofuscatus]|uniref:Zf-HC2 domain-containing protein n=1 Tax=Streptomyces cyaneofuscatus TaxID=66883 RepID=A0ABZ1F291_9ACTN|nr:zf-HC2 domain-containing protein [Streptomyces cyaneofuscatus]WSB10348.1 zf-HC2 domain-containing protein [Streptomyces cyaneofuscatus]WSD46119.1 zf-HC2 domain-containing protein [Streptomyces cyaneofuscatus]
MRRVRSGLGPTWHVGGELAARYAAGTAAESDAWSLEKHVEACGACAAVVSSAVRAGAETGPLLAGIRAAVLERAVQEPRESAYADTTISTGTGAGTTGVPPRLSRAARVVWAAGPALRGAWLVALAVVALGAVALSYGAGLGASVRPLLLVTAPVLPLAGVALSYGLHADPLYEIATSTPSGGLRLLLTRAAAVLAVSVPALTLAGAVLPVAAGGPGAAAWLLPGLALTLAALALGSFAGGRRGAAAVGAAWLAFVVAPAAAGGPAGAALMAGAAPYFAGPAVQSGWAAGAAACALLLAARRRAFDHLQTP